MSVDQRLHEANCRSQTTGHRHPACALIPPHPDSRGRRGTGSITNGAEHRRSGRRRPADLHLGRPRRRQRPGDVFVIQSLLNSRLPKPHAPMPVNGWTMSAPRWRSRRSRPRHADAPPTGHVAPGSPTYYALAARPLVENAPPPASVMSARSRRRSSIPPTRRGEWAIPPRSQSRSGPSRAPGGRHAARQQQPVRHQGGGRQPAVESQTREVIDGEDVTIAARFRISIPCRKRSTCTAGCWRPLRSTRRHERGRQPRGFADALTGVYATDPNTALR